MSEENKDESQLQTVKGSELAIGIQFSAAVGRDRQIVLTAGVPITLTPGQINEYVDKMAYVMDRQNWKGELKVLRNELEMTEKELVTNMQQLDSARDRMVADWERSKRRGPFRMSDAQEKNDATQSKNIAHLRDERIPKYKRQIAELEAQIAGG